MKQLKADELRTARRLGELCPRCDAHGPHRWDGVCGRYAGYTCTACGMQWDADEFTLRPEDDDAPCPNRLWYDTSAELEE